MNDIPPVFPEVRHMDERLRSLPPAELDNIMEIARRIAGAVHPLRIYLFGSFADGSWGDDSDYDFYIVVEDGANVKKERYTAGMSIWNVQKRSVDILVGTETKYNTLNPYCIESEVHKKGVLLFERQQIGDIAV